MVGDGAMQMGGMAEMLTAAKYYKTWADPRLIVLVLNNEDLNQVTWEQRVMEGDPQFEASQEIPYVDYAAWAELIGLKGIKLDAAPSEIEEALARGAERRPSGDHQRAERPERAAATAAYHLRTGRELRQVGPRRSRPTGCPARSSRCARRSTSSSRAAEMRLRQEPAAAAEQAPRSTASTAGSRTSNTGASSARCRR